jgi:hypothetical protein
MKKLNYVFPLLFVLISFTACEKAFVSKNENQAFVQTARGGKSATTTTYGGQASGVNATVVNTSGTGVTSYQTIIAQTPFLSTTGGSLVATALQGNIPGVFTADSVGAKITGEGNVTSAQSTATNVTITVGGHVVTASYVQSNASASCGPVFTATAQVQNLVVDGSPVVVTGSPNQVVFFPAGGFVIINEQSSSKKGGTGSLTVTALRVSLPNGTAIRVAGAKVDIKC